MKHLLIICSCLFAVIFAAAQNNYDSIIRKAAERYIGHPDCDRCDSAGVALLKIFKSNDSLQVQVLYASEPMYDIQGYKNLGPWMHKRLGKLIKNNYNVLLPLYFRYNTEAGEAPQVSNHQKEKLEKIAREQRRKMHLTQPLTIIGYAPVR